MTFILMILSLLKETYVLEELKLAVQPETIVIIFSTMYKCDNLVALITFTLYAHFT